MFEPPTVETQAQKPENGGAGYKRRKIFPAESANQIDRIQGNHSGRNDGQKNDFIPAGEDRCRLAGERQHCHENVVSQTLRIADKKGQAGNQQTKGVYDDKGQKRT